MLTRVVIESPLSGDFVLNFRYLLWCCRAAWLQDGVHAIASHLLCPWYMDDTQPDERVAGMANPWAWLLEIPHWYFQDLGFSSGMKGAWDRCAELNIPCVYFRLRQYDPECWAAFERGEWPPHTPGFEVQM